MKRRFWTKFLGLALTAAFALTALTACNPNNLPPEVRRAMRVEREKNERVVLAGDFNIAPADADLWNPQTWPDKILTTGPERTALERLLSDGFVDAFRAFPQKEKQFSWWDYRMAAYEQNHGLRIDLMLASDALRPALKACQIDETPRAWAKPSDHAPVVTMLSF